VDNSLSRKVSHFYDTDTLSYKSYDFLCSLAHTCQYKKEAKRSTATRIWGWAWCRSWSWLCML